MSSIVFVSPTGHWHPRPNDAYGSGSYGASRKRFRDGRTIRESHPGLDLFIEPGDTVLSPVVGQIFRHIRCYSSGIGAEHYTGISIDASWCRIELLYVGFNPDALTVGTYVEAGEIIGRAQDLRTRYPARDGNEPITPHIHLEFIRIDPAAVWAAMGIIQRVRTLSESVRNL